MKCAEILATLPPALIGKIDFPLSFRLVEGLGKIGENERTAIVEEALEALKSGKAQTLKGAVASVRGLPPELPTKEADTIGVALDKLIVRLAHLKTDKVQARDLACDGLRTARSLIGQLAKLSG